ncbi:MAG: hypothetical protein AABX04_04770 [Nanoarchaeota archaeon]
MIEQLKKYSFVEAVIQFGSSLTRKDYRDIDICVFTSKKISLKQKLTVVNTLPEKLDVSFYDDLPLNVKQEVFRGKILFCKDRLKLLQEQQRVNDEMVSYSCFLNNYHRERMKAL